MNGTNCKWRIRRSDGLFVGIDEFDGKLIYVGWQRARRFDSFDEADKLAIDERSICEKDSNGEEVWWIQVEEIGPQWVNAYAVSRNYGGPEEGGWWYDSGEPLASVPIDCDDDPEPVKARLKELIGWDKHPSQGRYSVIGGADFEIYVEDKMAQPFPERTPHYE